MRRLILLISIFTSIVYNTNLNAQDSQVDYTNPKKYIISDITISGVKFLDKSTLISISGLKLGDEILIPGDDISNAIRKLWQQGLFSDISININKIENNKASLNIELTELPKLSKFKFEGEIKKHEITSLKEQLKLMRGKILSENLIKNSIYKIQLYFSEKGFNNVQVDYNTEEDKETINGSSITFLINKGPRIKIKNIIIHGRKLRENNNKNLFDNRDMTYAISDQAISRRMKETKKKKWWRLFKSSKYNQENLNNDLISIIEKYNEKGFRDARILKDTFYLNPDNTINIEVWIFEGEPYKYRNIKFVGNTKYSDKELLSKLSINEGDILHYSLLT